jgi:calcium-dependent protein kinase
LPTKLYIISELCTGGELFNKITQEKHFEENIAGHIMQQLLSAVNFCHSNNIIHRDLKPENILIENEEELKRQLFTIKIIDFGTSDKYNKNKMHNKKIGTPYYIAPEVLNNSYNEKCDIWSCGVIFYILITGSPPFDGETDEEIFSAVRAGKYTLDDNEWKDISEDAKDLLKQLLTKDIKKRISAKDALDHIWIKKMKLKNFGGRSSVTPENLALIADNLKNYNANQKLQQATLAFIVHNIVVKEDYNELKEAFIEFDVNGDGRLTKDELYHGLNRIMTPTQAQLEVSRVMNIIDVDGNGYIELEEFLRATLTKEKILTDKNLQIAFNIFDKDRSGSISSEEIRMILGKDGNISDDIWNKILYEIDTDGDGTISYKEFKEMMNKILIE